MSISPTLDWRTFKFHGTVDAFARNKSAPKKNGWFQ